MFFISQQLAIFVLRIIIENTKRKCDFNIRNLTNSGLLTIGKHYTLTGSSAFLFFEVFTAQHMAPYISKCTTKEKMPLMISRGLSKAKERQKQ